MSDKKISALPVATSINSTDIFPLVQSGTTMGSTIANLLANLPAPAVTTQAAEATTGGASSGAATALSITNKASLVSNASGTSYYSLAAASTGVTKMIAASSISATGISIAVVGGNNFTTITFSSTAVGGTITLDYIGSNWYVRSVGGKVPPTIA